MTSARRILVFALLATLVFPLALHAQGATPEPSAAQWQVPLASLGLGDAVRLSGQIAQRDLFIPVPVGLTAVDLTATVQLSADVQSGFLEARSGDTVLTSIPLPASGEVITIPLDGAVVRDGVVPLTLAARLRSQDDVCTNALIGAWLDLSAGQIEYNGAGVPTTVAEFLPPLLTRLNILIPPDVDASEAAAALQLTSAVTARYPAQKVDVQVAALDSRDALPASVSDNPFERTIVIRSGGGDSVALIPAGTTAIALQITGSGDGLARQIGLFLGHDALAIAPEVTVQSIATPTATFSASTYSFDALGFTNLQVTGMGRMELPFSIAQADLGGAISSLGFRVAGTYTPMQGDDRGTLSLLVNGALIDAAALDSSGSFDRSFGVPGDLLSRDNTLTVRFDYSPSQTACKAGLEPFTGQVSGSSYVTSGGGQSLPAGFDRFPQAFVGAFPVAFESLDPAALANAANVVAALQRTTRTTLQPTVTDWAEALAAKTPALLVSANANSAESLNPPLSSAPIRVVKADGTELLRIDADTPLTALEAFEQNGRDLLLVEGAPDAVSALTRTLLTDALGWYGLQGDTWMQVGSAAPVSLTLQGDKLSAQPLTPPVQPWYVQILPPLVFVIALVIVLALLAVAYPRVVRKTPTGANK